MMMSRNNTQAHDCPCKKSKPQTDHNCGVGSIINGLPKEVIIHILSLLPLADAVRTSVLSKDWEYRWASIYHLTISDQPMKKASFVNFVDNILLHSQNIQSFRLSCHHMHDSVTLKRWISSLSMRSGIQSIGILAPHCKGSTLPNCLFNSTSVTSLKLTFPFTFKIPPTKDYFCNLKTLCLVHFHFENEDFANNNDRLMLTFPVLIQLQLNCCTWGSNIKLVDICSPSLTKFAYTSFTAPPSDFLIKVCGAKLQLFIIFGDVLLDNFNVNASSILRLYITNGSPRCDHPLVGVSRSNSRLSVNDFSGLKVLRLCARLTKTYAQLMPGHGLPRFDMLQSLKLEICGSIEAFLELLHMVPTLKRLTLSPHPKKGHFSEDFDFDGVGFVPSCMLSHLRKIDFLEVLGTTCELHLVTFMLKNSLKLEDIEVHILDKPLIPKTFIKDLLLVYPRGSTHVSLVVT